MDVLLIAIVGVVLGGVVNVLADDLPDGRVPGAPKYRDGSPRPLLAWLGITAFVCRRRRPGTSESDEDDGTRHWTANGSGDCRLSWRYPLTEVALAALMTLTHLVARETPAAGSSQILLWQCYTVCFLLIAVADLERKIILPVPLAGVAFVALIEAAAFPQPGLAVASAILGALSGGFAFTLIYLGGRFFVRLASQRLNLDPGVIAFGSGDVYLMAICGLVVGFPRVIPAMLLALLLGGAAALLYAAIKRLTNSGYRRFSVIPYGPSILAATYIVLLFGDEIVQLQF